MTEVETIRYAASNANGLYMIIGAGSAVVAGLIGIAVGHHFGKSSNHDEPLSDSTRRSQIALDTKKAENAIEIKKMEYAENELHHRRNLEGLAEEAKIDTARREQEHRFSIEKDAEEYKRTTEETRVKEEIRQKEVKEGEAAKEREDNKRLEIIAKLTPMLNDYLLRNPPLPLDPVFVKEREEYRQECADEYNSSFDTSDYDENDWKKAEREIEAQVNVKFPIPQPALPLEIQTLIAQITEKPEEEDDDDDDDDDD